MKIGICLQSETGSTGGGDPSALDVVEMAKLGEQTGFDSVWLPEHPVMPVHHNTKYPGSPDGSIPQRNPIPQMAPY